MIRLKASFENRNQDISREKTKKSLPFFKQPFPKTIIAFLPFPPKAIFSNSPFISASSRYTSHAPQYFFKVLDNVTTVRLPGFI